MRYQDLTEGRNSKCIVIDVQPQYTRLGKEHLVTKMVPQLMQFLNKQGPILMFVNAEDQGLTGDTVSDIKIYWDDSGFNNWSRVSIVDKGYGYLRSWMDHGIPDAVIIKAIREMYSQKVWDSRELFSNQDDYSYAMEQFFGSDFENIMLDDNLMVEWVSVSQLRKFNGAYLMGGACNQCLKEVTLIMNAFNIKYKLVERFIY